MWPFNLIAAVSFACSLLLSLAKGESSDNTCDETMATETISRLADQGDTKCRLYLAESSISGAGMGVYSGIDVPEGADIGNPDIVIPTFDDEFPTSLLSNYNWDGGEYGAHPEAEKVKNFSPGILAAVNGHPALMNVWHKTLISSDGAGLHRYKDPGAGGFTTYHNAQTIATAPIQAGTELLGDYGDIWYADRKEIDAIALSHHYEEADRIVKMFHDFDAEHSEEVSRDALFLFWNFLRESMVSDALVSDLLPESVDDLEEIERKGAALYHAPKNFIRSLEWLEEHGLCIDNLRADISTIPQAGRGAFATRFLPEGSIIAPMPLIHHCNKNGMVYYSDGDEEQERKQVILNYCFGHRSSSMLLCPYGAVTGLINHKSDSPNAKIRWSTSKHHNADWLQTPLKDLCGIYKSGVMFDLVANRDISPGDEIFIDYGEEWEMAWKEHVASWVPPEDSDTYVPASQWNKTETVVKTLHEQQDDPYPSNIYTECYFQWIDDEEEVINDGVYYKTYRGYETNYDLHECNIDARIPVNGTHTYYTAAMIVEGTKVIVEGLPREAIRFSDKAYSSDMHLSSAFRHEIMIPDEMFPEAWKFFVNDG